MRLNPFNVNYFNKLFIFHEKNESVILKIYVFVEFSKLKESMKIIQEKLKDYKNICFGIQIHYEYPTTTFFLSLNIKTDGNFLKIHDFEDEFQEIDGELANNYVDINDPYRNVYFTLFSGIDAFLMKIVKNQVILFDPMSRKNIMNIALFHVKLSNLEVATRFFNFFTDLSLKMKLKFEIYFFIKRENDKMLIDSNLAFIEKNRLRFQEMLEKFSTINELRVMLEVIPVNKKKITELFIRRPLEERFDFKIDEHLDFLSKYIPDQQVVANEKDENGINPLDEYEPTTDTAVLSMESPVTGKIEDSVRIVFQESLQSLNIKGDYVDLQEYVFDDGNTIYFLIHELNVKALLDLLKIGITKRKFKLIFIDPEELAEFIKILPPKINGILDSVSLEEFNVGL